MAGTVSVRAPGQAASTARSTRPGGIGPGTHRAMVSPPSLAVSSKPRWGWPPRSRRQAGRSRATRLVHKVAAPCGSTSGGARTRDQPGAVGHAAAWARRRHGDQRTTRASAMPAAAGPNGDGQMGGHAGRGGGASRAVVGAGVGQVVGRAARSGGGTGRGGGHGVSALSSSGVVMMRGSCSRGRGRRRGLCSIPVRQMVVFGGAGQRG